MGDLLEWFAQEATGAFAWLAVEYLCRIPSEGGIRNQKPIFASVLWTNDQVFVEVILECPRPALDVQFGLLLGNRPPPSSATHDRYHLEELAAVRGAQGSAPEDIRLRSLRKRDIRRSLRTASLALHLQAPLVLQGRPTIFLELDAAREARRQS